MEIILVVLDLVEDFLQGSVSLQRHGKVAISTVAVAIFNKE